MAALAALIIDYAPHITPAEIKALLQETAQDMDDPYTPGFQEGFDNRTGYGFVNGTAALEQLAAQTNRVRVEAAAAAAGGRRLDDGGECSGTQLKSSWCWLVCLFQACD